MNRRRQLHPLLAAAWVALALAGQPLGAAEPVAQACATAEADVVTLRRQLDETYTRLGAEKLRLTQESEALATQTRTLQADADAALGQRREHEEALRQLGEEQARLRQLSRTLANLSLEYRRDFESRLSVAEVDAAEPTLTRLDAALGAAPESLGATPRAALLGVSLERAENAIGGRRFPGRALAADGLLLEGTYISFGPLSFFQAKDGPVGLAVQQIGSLHPLVYARFDAPRKAALDSLFASGRGRVPVDVTMGAGIRLEESRETLVEHLTKGGPVMVPLLALGLACAVIICYKLTVVLTLATGRCQERVIEIIAAVNAGEVARAETLAATLRVPLRAVIRAGLAHRDATKEHLEEILYEQILVQVPAIERFLSPLAVGASAAPLLGLLGTVTGMIRTFRLITVFGTGDARLISAGISEALITTEVGLMIAIPTLLFHAYFSRRVRRAVGLVQEVAVTFVNGIKLKGAGPT
jgi:biopolymer transport protein ExbB